MIAKKKNLLLAATVIGLSTTLQASALADASSPTLNRINEASTTYVNSTARTRIVLSAEQGENTNSVKIIDTDYYFTLDDSVKGVVSNLVNTGYASLYNQGLTPANPVFMLEGTPNSYFSYNTLNLPNSVYTATAGTAQNYNFVTSDGTTTNYWKINIPTQNLVKNINNALSYTEVSSSEGYAVNLPNGEIKYFKPVYVTPVTYGTLNERLVVTTESSVNNLSFQNNVLNSTEMSTSARGGALVVDNKTLTTINSDFVNNSVDFAAMGVSDDPHGGGAYVANSTVDTIRGNYINNGIANSSRMSIGGGLELWYSTVDKVEGNFISNYITAPDGQSDGRFYGGGLRIGNGSSVNGVEATFVGNHIIGGGKGGAIDVIGSAKYINADFLGNYIETSATDAYGGALSLSSGGVRVISVTGDFIGNYVKAESNPWGGAVMLYSESTNFAEIDSLTGDFISNQAINTKSDGTARGGAIALYGGKIGDITGNFIGNKAVAEQGSVSGGAIWSGNNYNFHYSNTNEIGSITGDFIENESIGKFGADAGAINNDGTIGDINGNFIRNKASVNYTNRFSNSGAIKNAGTIGAINGNFIENEADQYSAIGNVNSSSVIGNITGNFIGNKATYRWGALYNYGKVGDVSGTYDANTIVYTPAATQYEGHTTYDEANGAAIANNGTMGSISGTFTNNSVLNKTDDSWNDAYSSAGGAIFNDGKIANISGTFENNSVSMPYQYSGSYNSKGAHGGAIFSNDKIGYDADGNKIEGNGITNSIFTNNTVQSSDVAFGGAIAYGRSSDNRDVLDIIDSSFYNNSASVNATSTSRYGRMAAGGAIALKQKSEPAANSGGTINIKAANNQVIFDHNTANQGGAVWQGGHYGAFNVIADEVDSYDNSVVFSNNSAEMFGGAIGAFGTYNISGVGRTLFENNTAKGAGGAIFHTYPYSGKVSYHRESSIKNADFIGNNVTGEFNEQGTSSQLYFFQRFDGNNAGGAVYNDSGIISTIENSTFTGNSVSSASTNGYGGAIFNNYMIGQDNGYGYVDSETGIIDSQFIGNSASTAGGAIYNSADAKGFNIIAKTKDVEFSGNKAPEGAAIYNLSSDGVNINALGGDILFNNNNSTGTSSGTGSGIYSTSMVSLLTDNNHSITINDNIDLSDSDGGWAELSIMAKSGDVNLNGSILTGENAGIYLGTTLQDSEGIVTLGQTPANATYNKITVASGNNLSLINNHAGDNIIFNEMYVQGMEPNLNFGVDYDATSNVMDKITVKAAQSGSKITLNAVNVINDNEDFVNGTQATYLDGAARNSITVISDAITSTVAGSTVYTFTPVAITHGLLSVSREDAPYSGDLINAIQDTESVHPAAYSMLADFTADRNFGALSTENRDDFTIFGNGKTISGDNSTYTGIEVASGQTLNLDSVVFSNVKTYDVQNAGTLNLSGNNTIKTITDAATPTGTTNITGGATWIKGGSVTQNTINLKGGDLVLDLSTSLPLTPGTITANIVGDGTVEKTGIILNSGTINGTISGTFKGNNNTALANYGTVGNITADFVNNTATVLSSNAKGGAIYNEGGTLGTISGNFTGNSATSSSGNTYGGAIYQEGGTLTISGSTFGGSEEGQGNTAASTANSKFAYGGAIYHYSNDALTLSDTIFEKNSVSSTGTYNSSDTPGAHGGAIFKENGTLTIVDTQFKDNSATAADSYTEGGANGGAIYLNNGTYSISGTKSGTGDNVTSTTIFENNKAINTGGASVSWNGQGAALYTNNSSGTIDQVVFKNNDANNGKGHGGAIRFGAGSHTVSNSVFIGNSAGNGSAIGNSNATSLAIQNSVFTGNYSSLDDGSVVSTVVLDEDAIVNITDSNFTDNTGTVIYQQGGKLNITDTDITGNTGNAIKLTDNFYAHKVDSVNVIDKISVVANIIAQNEDVNIDNNTGYGILANNPWSSENSSLTLYAKGSDITINGNTAGGINNNGLALTLNADTGHNITINDSVSSNVGMTVNSDNNAGTVALNGALTLGSALNVNDGTLKLGTAAAGSTFKTVAFTNTPTLDLQNTTADTMVVDKITGYATLNIDVNSTTSVSDAIQIATTGSSGTLTVNSLSFLDDVTTPESFNINVITKGAEGDISEITLAISDTLAEQYNDPTPTATDYDKPYTYNSNINFDTTKFTTEKWTKTTQKQLTVTSSETAKGLKLNVNVISDVHKQDGEGHYIYDTNYDALQVLNQHEGERTLTADGVGVNTYQVGSDLGTTATGTLNVTGKSGGSNLDMNNKTGFVVSNADTTLNLTNLNITNINDTQDGGLINLTGDNSVATLENVTVGSTTNAAIVNDKTLNLKGNTTLNSSVKGTGTTNINGGKTILAKISQKLVNIASGELEVADITTTSGITNAGKLTLTGTSNENAITGTGSTVIAENIANTGSIGQAITVNEEKTFTTAANLIGGAVTNSGTLELTGGTLEQSINGGNIIVKSGEVTSTAANLGGAITNNAALKLSGTLDKTISGTNGVTKINSSLIMNADASIEGTIDLNNGLLVLSGDNTATQYNVNKLTNSGHIKVDIDYSDTPVADSVNIAVADSNAKTITVDDIAEIGTAADSFDVQVLSGATENITLVLNPDLAERYKGQEVTEITYETDDYTPTIDFDKTTFDTKEFTEKSQKTLSVVDNIKLKLDKVITEAKHQTGIQSKDALVYMNEHTGTRAMKATTAESSNAYTLTADLGTTATGSMTVEGRSAEDLGTLDMNGKAGFTVSSADASVTLKNLNITNAKAEDGALINITNSGATAELDGVYVSENSANLISSKGTVAVNNSTVNAGISNTGVLNLNGTTSIDKVVGEAGTTNVNGQATVKSLTQKLVNIVTGGKLVANGDVTTGTGSGEGIVNAVDGGLELNNATLSGNVSGSGSVKATGETTIAEGTQVSQTLNVASGNLTNSGTLSNASLTDGALVNKGTITEAGISAGTLTNEATIANASISAGSLVNNGSLNTATLTGGSLTSSADNILGTVTNGGDLNITGGTVSTEITGTGNISIQGDTAINKNVAATGNVSVADGVTISLSAANDSMFTNASGIELGDNSTLNLLNGSGNSKTVNNIKVSADSIANVQMAWGDVINSSDGDIDGSLSVTKIDLSQTDGANASYVFTNLGNNIAFAGDVDIISTDTSSNFVKYNAANGQINSNRNTLKKAVDETTVGERATYVMTGSETGGNDTLTGELTVKGNGNTVTGGGIVVGDGNTAGADLVLEDVNIGAVATGGNDGALVVKGGNNLVLKAVSQDVTMEGSDNGTVIYLEKDDTLGAANVTLNAEGGTIEISDDIKSSSVDNVINFSGANDINFSGTFDPATANVNTTLNRTGGYDEAITYNINAGGLLNYSNDSILYDSTHHTVALMNTINFNGGSLSLMNGSANNINLAALNVNANSNIYVDVDAANKVMDTISSTAITSAATLNVAGMNIYGTPVVNEFETLFVDATLGNTALIGQVTTSVTNVDTGIYKYLVSYIDDGTTGKFKYNVVSSPNTYLTYSPSAYSSSVAMQAAYLGQINVYDTAFGNLDQTMLLTNEQRKALRYGNKYADNSSNPQVYSPLYSQNENKGIWFRPYVSFEKVNLSNGPDVNNVMYGSLVGGDTDIISIGNNGWEGQFSAYAGYNGSHQTFDGVGIYQNGGAIGATGAFYKGNFFTALTASVGANVADIKTPFGSNDLTMLTAGLASKTGYNWELLNGKMIIQPSWTMSYTFLNPFENYTMANGVRLENKALNAIQLAPGIKVIGNLPKGWQPYLGVNMRWNIIDETKVKANAVNIPETSVDPYVEYGLGLQKTVGDRFTGFGQAMFRGGGRNGVSFTFGFRWALGDLKDKHQSAQKNAVKSTKLKNVNSVKTVKTETKQEKKTSFIERIKAKFSKSNKTKVKANK